MRTTSIRNAVRCAMMLAASTGVSLATASARADVAPDESDPNTSTGTAVLKIASDKGLDTSIDTGFRGFSAASVSAEVRAVVRIDPVFDGGPLYTIEMPKGAVVQAHWARDKKIVLKTSNGSQTDGLISVRHTLTPELQLKLSAFGVTATFSYDANMLLNVMQGSQFAYDSAGSEGFVPWGFNPAVVTLNAPDLDNSTLFSVGMYKIPELISVGFDGELGVRATTNPTFSYTTKTVTLQGGRVIDANGGEVVLPAVDGDFLETTVAVGGELSVTGDIQVQPYIHLSTVPALGDASIDIPVTVFAQTYSTPATKVAFPSVKVHIPLPNVRVPSEGVDLGDVKAGASGTASVTIRNSGEKAATMSFKSSDAQYDVPEGRITLAPKGTYELPIAFTSGSSGPTSADITVTSNDPDSPEQVFKVGANGAVTRGSARGAKDAADSADGCGCRNAGTTSPVGGWLGVGVLAVTAAAFARRRRSGA